MAKNCALGERYPTAGRVSIEWHPTFCPTVHSPAVSTLKSCTGTHSGNDVGLTTRTRVAWMLACGSSRRVWVWVFWGGRSGKAYR